MNGTATYDFLINLHFAFKFITLPDQTQANVKSLFIRYFSLFLKTHFRQLFLSVENIVETNLKVKLKLFKKYKVCNF
jgi:hypothetical protein